MKVNTNLKSGNLVTDVSNLVKLGSNQVVDFFSTAEQQASAVTNTVNKAAQSAWNSLTGWIRP